VQNLGTIDIVGKFMKGVQVPVELSLTFAKINASINTGINMGSSINNHLNIKNVSLFV